MATHGGPVRQRTGLALTSLILAVVSLCTGAGLVVGGIAACVMGIVALVKASRYPQEYGGTGLAIAGVIISALSLISLPLLLAVFIPSLLRARVSANEAMAIGDLRAFVASQAAYQSVNGGLFDTPRCLGEPGACIPRYTGPTFVDAAVASMADKGGYRRTFHSVPPSDPIDPAVQSPSSVGGYAIVAVPVQASRTGVRGFCADHTGMICSTPDGRAPQLVDGACPPPPACTPIL